MKHDFLQYFEQELTYVEQSFKAFKQKHPQAAKKLKLNDRGSDDPEVQRLIETFAAISAKLTKRLDAATPEVALNLMGMLNPGLLIGTPSYCPIYLDSSAAPIAEKIYLKRGDTANFTSDNHVSCLFSVAKDVTLNPIIIESIAIEKAPFWYQEANHWPDSHTVMSINLRSMGKGILINSLNLSEVGIYFAGDHQQKRRLKTAFAQHLLGAYVMDSDDRLVGQIDSSCFQPCFKIDPSTYLPSFETDTIAFEKLHDYFAYPDKTAFFQINGLSGFAEKIESESFKLKIFFSKAINDTIDRITLDNIITNVVPTVNYFYDSTFPLRYDYAVHSVPVKPISSNEMDVWVLRILEVFLLDENGEQKIDRYDEIIKLGETNLVWQELLTIDHIQNGRANLCFSSNGFDDADANAFDFTARLLCSNGESVSNLDISSSVNFTNTDLEALKFLLIHEPINPVPPNFDNQRLWDLITMLRGNLSSIFDAANPTESLQEILTLYANPHDSRYTQAIKNVTIEKSVAPVRINGRMLHTSGNIVKLTINKDILPESMIVFTEVINNFFRLFISYDRFVQLIIYEHGNIDPVITFPRSHGFQQNG